MGGFLEGMMKLTKIQIEEPLEFRLDLTRTELENLVCALHTSDTPDRVKVSGGLGLFGFNGVSLMNIYSAALNMLRGPR